MLTEMYTYLKKLKLSTRNIFYFLIIKHLKNAKNKKKIWITSNFCRKYLFFLSIFKPIPISYAFLKKIIINKNRKPMVH